LLHIALSDQTIDQVSDKGRFLPHIAEKPARASEVQLLDRKHGWHHLIWGNRATPSLYVNNALLHMGIRIKVRGSLGIDESIQ